jgi:hypothetical protein
MIDAVAMAVRRVTGLGSVVEKNDRAYNSTA